MPQQAESAKQVAAARLGVADAGAFLALLAACVLLRIATFGHTSFHDDDLFYVLVGQRMHDGLLPYVDIWDRKPFGLFAIFYLIAGISRAVWAYQIAGWCFIAATAWVIHRIVLTWTDRLAAVLAGLAYVTITFTFGGENGQSPVFYNLFVAVAALLVVRHLQAPGKQDCGPRIWIAMALCGVAIAVKQTALFESLFLGLAVLAVLRRRGVGLGRLAKYALGFAAVGAAPMLAIAATYAWIGHWPEFWNAMVGANLNRHPTRPQEIAMSLKAIAMRLLLLAPVVGWALWRGIGDRSARLFLSGWLLAAIAGFLSVPNFFVHYALPVLVPMTAIAGFAFARASGGKLIFAAILCYDLLWHQPFDFASTRKATAAMDKAAAIVSRRDGGGGLLVFKGPIWLYAMSGKTFLTPIAFPHHMHHAFEHDISHLPTVAEVDRILANRPGVVVIGRYPPDYPINRETLAKVLAYVRRDCRSLDTLNIYDNRGQPTTIDIFGDCGKQAGQ